MRPWEDVTLGEKEVKGHDDVIHRAGGTDGNIVVNFPEKSLNQIRPT